MKLEGHPTVRGLSKQIQAVENKYLRRCSKAPGCVVSLWIAERNDAGLVEIAGRCLDAQPDEILRNYSWSTT
jgi:hypothetical protein